MISLVGYTGFVGSNIYAQGKIDRGYNSKNVEEAYGTKPDLLIYAGLRAEKYLANTNPDADMELILQAEDNISKIHPRRLVLISTIDVFKNPVGVDENSMIDTENLHAYGLNRYKLEQWVRERYQDALIIRLPGLFGKNLKKNFIYDFIHVIPFMLKEDKFQELVSKDGELRAFYERQENGFYKCRKTDENEEKLLKDKFHRLGFTALHFTDSRNRYQFYPLDRLWSDIRNALEYELRIWHPATEPVSAGEVYRYLTGKNFRNEIMDNPVRYDYRTLHAEKFGGMDKYLLTKQQVLESIKKFVEDI